MTPYVRKALKGSPNGFVSFSMKMDYEPRTGWSRGFIWLSPDLGPDSYLHKNTPIWKKGLVTYLITLHELGHVMGIQHNRNSATWFMADYWPQTWMDLAAGAHYKIDLATLPREKKLPSTRTLAEAGLRTNGMKLCNKLSNYTFTQNDFMLHLLLDLRRFQMDNLILMMVGCTALKAEVSLVPGSFPFKSQLG
jgi:hypothetical protein